MTRVMTCGDTPSRIAASRKLGLSAATQNTRNASNRFMRRRSARAIPFAGISNSPPVHLFAQARSPYCISSIRQSARICRVFYGARHVFRFDDSNKRHFVDAEGWLATPVRFLG